MNVASVKTRDYKNDYDFALRKTNPIKPNFKPTIKFLMVKDFYLLLKSLIIDRVMNLASKKQPDADETRHISNVYSNLVRRWSEL